MPTYITLINYTAEGVRDIRSLRRSLEEAEGLAGSLGAEIRAYYLTLGRFDAVLVVEAPDDEAYARLALALAGRGQIRTETLKAFTREEALRIVEGLG